MRLMSVACCLLPILHCWHSLLIMPGAFCSASLTYLQNIQITKYLGPSFNVSATWQQSFIIHNPGLSIDTCYSSFNIACIKNCQKARAP